MQEVKVGYHVSKSKGLVKNINGLIAQGGRAVQFFISPNIGAQAGIPLKDSEVNEIMALKAKYGLYTVVHGKYILNFARPSVGDTQWQQNALVIDMVQADRLGANVIIHQGKNMPELGYTNKEALDAFVQNIKQVLDITELQGASNKIVLENSCQQGNELGYTIEELAEIFDSFEPKYKSRISFCLDLCHIYVSGVMNVTLVEDVDRVMTTFDKLIGLDHLEVIHFNDSKVRFNGHNDCHADILVGYIGNAYMTSNQGKGSHGFQHIVKMAKAYSIPLILETPEDECQIGDQIRLLLSWSKGDSEYQKQYETQYAAQMMAFAKNPSSSKGKKAHNCNAECLLVPTVPAVPLCTVAYTAPQKKFFIRKITTDQMVQDKLGTSDNPTGLEEATKIKPKIIIKKILPVH